MLDGSSLDACCAERDGGTDFHRPGSMGKALVTERVLRASLEGRAGLLAPGHTNNGGSPEMADRT